MAAIAVANNKTQKPAPVSQIVADIKNTDRSIREDAASELASNGTPEQAAELCTLLYDHDISVRNLAAEVLVKMSHIAANALLAETASPDHDVRKFAVDIMALIGDRQFVPALVSLLKDKNENVVCSAAEALGRIKDPASVKALIECRKNHPCSELQVIEALGNIGSNEALPILYEVLNSDNVVLAYAAVEAVGKISTPEALNKLLSLLNVKNLPLRSTVLGAILKIANAGSRGDLFKISNGKYVDYLIEAAGSDDINVKSSVIKELAFWGGDKVVSALIVALKDSEQEIVNMALGALRITGDSGLAQIVEALQSGDDTVKKYLIEVSAF
jgi:HEAT repeat protein